MAVRMPPIGDLVGQLKQPGGHPDETRRGKAEKLPLEARVERAGAGWRIHLPLRAEQVRVEKHSVVAEQVVVRKRTIEDQVTVDEDLRREELDVDPETVAGYDATEPIRRPRRGYRPPYKI